MMRQAIFCVVTPAILIAILGTATADVSQEGAESNAREPVLFYRLKETSIPEGSEAEIVISVYNPSPVPVGLTWFSIQIEAFDDDEDKRTFMKVRIGNETRFHSLAGRGKWTEKPEGHDVKGPLPRGVGFWGMIDSNCRRDVHRVRLTPWRSLPKGQHTIYLESGLQAWTVGADREVVGSSSFNVQKQRLSLTVR